MTVSLLDPSSTPWTRNRSLTAPLPPDRSYTNRRLLAEGPRLAAPLRNAGSKSPVVLCGSRPPRGAAASIDSAVARPPARESRPAAPIGRPANLRGVRAVYGAGLRSYSASATTPASRIRNGVLRTTPTTSEARP